MSVAAGKGAITGKVCRIGLDFGRPGDRLLASAAMTSTYGDMPAVQSGIRI